MKNFKEKLLKGDFVEKVNESIKGESVDNLDVVHKIIAPIISYDEDREHFCTLYLNTKNKLIHLEISFLGSIASCTVHPREIIKKALMQKASALIFVHNHPSGDLSISSSDKRITKSLIVAADVHDIIVHDHVIINKKDFLSMADKGIIQRIYTDWRRFKNMEN